MELNTFHFETAGAAAHEGFAEARARGAQRDIDVIVERLTLAFAGLGALLGHVALADHADDAVIERIDLDGLEQGILKRKQAPRQSVRDGADVVLVQLICLRKETAFDDVHANDIPVGGEGSQDLAGDAVSGETDILANDANGQARGRRRGRCAWMRAPSS